MSFPELLRAFWYWWVTEGGVYEYTAELAEVRGGQLAITVVSLVFVSAIVFSKKLRSNFF